MHAKLTCCTEYNVSQKRPTFFICYTCNMPAPADFVLFTCQLLCMLVKALQSYRKWQSWTSFETQCTSDATTHKSLVHLFTI